MGEEIAGEVEADSQWLFLGWLRELHDATLHLTLAEAERLHTVDVRCTLPATYIYYIRQVNAANWRDIM